MLQKESVREPLWNLLRELLDSKIFINYFLVNDIKVDMEKIKQEIIDEVNNYNRTIVENI